jgi:hypothetical protein
MKKLIVILAAICLLGSIGLAQTAWTYDSDFVEGTQPHGLVVDNAGWIWYGWYGYSDTLGMPADTIPIAPIYVVDAAGNPAPFSPIRTVTVDGVTDTMDSYCRGLSVDNNGDIIFVGNQVMYRISATTGEGMAKYMYPASGSLTSAAVDDNGYVYVTKVVPGGGPLVILDADLEEYSTVLDSCFTIQRSLLVSGDGNDVYVPVIYAGVEGVYVYHSDSGPDGTYEASGDTLVYDLAWGQCGDWDRNGLMWIGSYWDVGPTQWGGWYALDPTQSWQVVDTLRHFVGARTITAGVPPAGAYVNSPRHAAWSLDGMTMYTADFDGAVIKKWTNANPRGPGDPIVVTSIDFDNTSNIFAVDFELAQNYPNPFNPTTNIPFDVAKKFQVKLAVYDVMGRQVAVLVDKELAPNHYEFQFNGSNLASGTYFYQLNVNGQVQTKQMMLIK